MLRRATYFILTCILCYFGPVSAQYIITNTGDTVRFSEAVHGPRIVHSYANDSVHITRYIDTIHGYATNIPDWLNLLNTGVENMFAGLFPEMNGTKNALTIECFSKDSFASFDDFHHQKIDKYQKGDAMMDNPDLKLNLKTPMKSQLPNKAIYKLQLIYYGDLLLHKWIFFETKKAYIQIVFNSTATSYPQNLERFEGFVDQVEFFE